MAEAPVYTNSYRAWADNTLAESRLHWPSGGTGKHEPRRVFISHFKPASRDPEQISRNYFLKPARSANSEVSDLWAFGLRIPYGMHAKGNYMKFMTVRSCGTNNPNFMVIPGGLIDISHINIRVDLKQRLAKARADIRAFKYLPKGWDSYDSEAPSQTAIESALSVIDHMEFLGVEPNWCIPTSDDSILLEFEWSNITYKWELESDGDIGVMIRPSEGEPEYLDLQAKQIAEFFTDHCHGAL
ncbi:MAG: hypothetical protein NTW21_19800 [Verrucomicrobia bacterium]|nr:hypothetical protein [Verrucomicrobiota bacterium]